MNATCFTEHAAYIKKWPNGISVCVLCNAKVDIEQAFQATVLREKLHGLVYNVGGETMGRPKGTKRKNRVVCPNCGSSQVLFRMRTNTFICRLCGERFPRQATPPPTKS